MFTRSSVHWAERIVATSSSSGFVWSRLHRARGYICLRIGRITARRSRRCTTVLLSARGMVRVARLLAQGQHRMHADVPAEQHDAQQDRQADAEDPHALAVVAVELVL